MSEPLKLNVDEMIDERLKGNLWNIVEAIYAYDKGATDSGIHDNTLRVRCISLIDSMSEDELRISISRFIRTKFLSETSLALGYSIQDAFEFSEWVLNDLGISRGWRRRS